MGSSEDCLDHPGRTLATFLCAVILCCMLTPAFIFIFLSAVNQTSVKCSVKDFYISEDQSTNLSNSNQSIIYFNLHLRNSRKYMRVYYDNINLTFSYYSSGGIVRVGNYTISGFHQGLHKETQRNTSAAMANGISWQQISKNSSLPSSSSVLNFRVDLSTAVRFRDNLSKVKSKTRKIMAWADVEVDRITGKKTSKKAIKLKNMIKHHVNGWVTFAFILMISAIVLAPCWCLCVVAFIGCCIGN